MFTLRKTTLILTFALFWIGQAYAATVVDVTLRIDRVIRPFSLEKKNIDPVLNLDNFILIKNFILAQGRRQTYCNMFNDNPAYNIADCYYYLNPDTGQANINCDPTKSDFNTLVIYGHDTASYHVSIKQGDSHLYINVSWPSADLNIERICNEVMEAFSIMQKEIKRIGYKQETSIPEESVENTKSIKPIQKDAIPSNKNLSKFYDINTKDIFYHAMSRAKIHLPGWCELSLILDKTTRIAESLSDWND